MLIYNYKKEFLGIDEADLEMFGLSDLSDLRAEAADFADLFIKTPGFIHNFKHVHWIDYITCNDVGVESKAIINIKGKNYSTILDINTIYLVDNPSEKAFIVKLTKVKALSASQAEKISGDILEKPAPQTATGSTEIFTVPGSILHKEENAHLQEDIGEIAHDPYAVSDVNINSNVIEDAYEDKTLNNDIDLSSDAPIDIEEDVLSTDTQNTLSIESEYQEEIKEIKEIKEEIKEEEIEGNAAFTDYIYDPYLASDELGLPIDLVEEFIQDFISQAENFKEGFYDYVGTNNMSSLKIQSHKLKGVAANLRIEDALDALTIINASDNIDEITMNLNRLYKIITKLSNKDNRLSNDVDEYEDEDEDEDFILSLKDDDIKLTKSPIIIEEVTEKSSSEFKKVSEVNELEEFNAESESRLEPEVESETKLEEKLIGEEIKNTELQIEQVDENKSLEDENIENTYDKESIANDMGLHINSFNESLDDYINESKGLVNSIIDAYKDDDLDKCKNIAIKLKGMSDNMRIHKFDNELDTIINATDINDLAELLDNILSKLNEISDSENK